MDHHQHREISSAFGYTDFEPSHELIGVQAGMEMLEIPSKTHRDPESWRGFFPNRAPSENFLVAHDTTAGAITNPWHLSNRMAVDDSSLRCLFPIEGNEQATQGLSLSLCNPEPMQQLFHHQLFSNSRDGSFPKPTNLQQNGRFFQSSPTGTLFHQPQQLKSSKYLTPAQELLNEFCSLGGSSSKHHKRRSKWEEGGSSSSSSWNQSLSSLDLLELQKRKARLLSMLEEVDKRYKRYSEQMRAVVSSFEAVAGEGAANVYSTLASKAMSRHFRCLRDGIVGQIQATRKAMGEKDPIAQGATRGETPRLRLLDQCLRQQKAFQQAGMMENHPWRPQRGLPERSISVLRAWLFEHFLHPYPSDVDKHILARQTGLSRSQVSNWFINARVRLWKPMVEEMYLEETKEQDNQSSHATVGYDGNSNSINWHSQLPSNRNPNPNPNPNPSNSQLQSEDQKPAPGQLLNDPGSLSSIINSSSRYHGKNPQLGVADLDFSSYNDGDNQRVSLTLGLQQHNGGGMNLSFSPPASQNFLFFSRENMDDCEPVQFSITDSEAQNPPPYRNLMGAQLLHDLAG